MPVRFDAAISEIMQEIFSMGTTAERMFDSVIQTLTQRNHVLLQSVAEDEKKMDNLQLRVDDQTVELIGVYTPVAADLRLLLMIPRISGAIERIGDQAENICHRVQHMLTVEPLKPLVDLPHMADIARQMLRISLKAFAERSTEQAVQVLRMDSEVDAIHRRMQEELLGYMERDPKNVRRAFDLMMIGRAVERVGDHAVSIAEATIYAVSGKDVRHLHIENDPRPMPLPPSPACWRQSPRWGGT
jgi:phosphate transport system protein